MVTELCSAQFWSEITLVFLSQIHAARSFDFEITRTISGLISHVQIFQHAENMSINLKHSKKVGIEL